MVAPGVHAVEEEESESGDEGWIDNPTRPHAPVWRVDPWFWFIETCWMARWTWEARERTPNSNIDLSTGPQAWRGRSSLL